MTEQELRLEILLSEEDYLRVQKGLVGWQVYPLIFVFGVLLLAFLLQMLQIHSLWLSILMLVLLLVMVFFYLPRKQRQTWQKQFASHATLKEVHTYLMNEEGLTAVSANSNSQQAWEELYDYRELAEDMLLFLAQNLALILPKHCFASPAELEQLRGYLQRVPKPQPEKRRWLRLIPLVLLAAFLILAVLFARGIL